MSAKRHADPAAPPVAGRGLRSPSRAQMTLDTLAALVNAPTNTLTGSAPRPSLTDNSEERSAQDSPGMVPLHVNWIPLGAIRPSRYQYRTVSPESIEELANQLASDRLLHAPQARPVPGLLGEYELVVGHRRVAALRQLAERGIQHPDLRYGADRTDIDAVEIPVSVDEQVGELRARWRALTENESPERPSAWETSLAVAALIEALSEAGDGELSVTDLQNGARHRARRGAALPERRDAPRCRRPPARWSTGRGLGRSP